MTTIPAKTLYSIKTAGVTTDTVKSDGGNTYIKVVPAGTTTYSTSDLTTWKLFNKETDDKAK